jgi:formyl-CoA transferase
VPTRIGTANRMAAPYQAVEAANGHFVFGANNDRLWQRLCIAIERPDLAGRPDYATNADRMANRPALIAELETTFRTRPKDEWVTLLLAAGIPAGPINDFREALENPHTEARQMVMEIDHPVEGRVRNIGFPVKLHGTPQAVRRPPPLLGEHRDEILRELGLAPAESR